MNRLIISVLIVTALIACAFIATREVPTPASRAYIQHANWHEFVDYMRDFAKVYEHEQEILMRFGIYLAAKAKIEHHNSMKLNWTMGINQFADLTQAEFLERVMMPINMEEIEDDDAEYGAFEPTTLEEVDYEKAGFTTSVKQQGHCLSCWAFAAAGALEGIFKRRTGRIESLSTQQLMACSTAYGNGNCNSGGFPANAFKYVKDHGIETEASYPYINNPGPCRYDFSKLFGRIHGYGKVEQHEYSLKFALANQPIAVIVDPSTWSYYKGGVMTMQECGTGAGHAVLAAGYGTQNGMMYWKLKNSWGPDFGENGYIKVQRTDGPSWGACNVAWRATYPIY